MSLAYKVQLVLAATFLLGVFPAAVIASTGKAAMVSAYLDEPVLVFSSESTARPLPDSIFTPGVPFTFASNITLACQGVHGRNNDLLVYLPASQICMSLHDLHALAREFHPRQALFAVLERDRKHLLKGLETEAFIIMQPNSGSRAVGLSAGVEVAGVCICPNPVENVFSDGFEEQP